MGEGKDGGKEVGGIIERGMGEGKHGRREGGGIIERDGRERWREGGGVL